jgi:hypothetical protein
MITPNKVVTLGNSALGLVGVILEQGSDPIGLMELCPASVGNGLLPHSF